MNVGAELPADLVDSFSNGRFVINPKVDNLLPFLSSVLAYLCTGKPSQWEWERLWELRSACKLACGLVPLGCVRLAQPEVQQSSLGDGSTLRAGELGPTLDTLALTDAPTSSPRTRNDWRDRRLRLVCKLQQRITRWRFHNVDRKSTRLNSSHRNTSRMPSSA